jgi:hypothetical protein
MRTITRRHLEVIQEEARTVDEYDRPATRADCVAGGINEARPCPWVGCVHHLYLDVSPMGSIKFNFPDVSPEELEKLSR